MQNLDIVVKIAVSKLRSIKPAKVTDKVRTTFQKVKYFEKLAHNVPSNANPNHIV